MKTLENYKNYFAKNLDELRDGLQKYLHEAEKLPSRFGRTQNYPDALKKGKTDFLQDTHLDAVRDVLKSWGMIRGGETGLVEPELFKMTIRKYRQKLEELKNCTTLEGKSKIGDILDLIASIVSPPCPRASV